MLSDFKYVAISKYGEGSQLMSVVNLCLEAVHGIQASRDHGSS